MAAGSKFLKIVIPITLVTWIHLDLPQINANLKYITLTIPILYFQWIHTARMDTELQPHVWRMGSPQEVSSWSRYTSEVTPVDNQTVILSPTWKWVKFIYIKRKKKRLSRCKGAQVRWLVLFIDTVANDKSIRRKVFADYFFTNTSHTCCISGQMKRFHPGNPCTKAQAARKIIDCVSGKWVVTNVGDFGLWEVCSREKLVLKNFKVWDLGAWSMPFQVCKC